MAEYDSPADVDRAIEALRAKGWSRNAIHEELLRTGLTNDQATDVLDGVPITIARPDPSRPPPLPSTDTGPVGIGGWLILPAIGMVLGPILTVVGLTEILPVLKSSELVEAERLHPGLTTLVTFEAIALEALTVLMIVTAVLFFLRKRWAPRTVIVLLAFRALVSIGDAIWLKVVLPKASVDPGELLGVVGAAAVWIPYFLVSKRVKNTFIR